MGARGIEFDIRSTKDNAFIVFHDESLDEKTNGTGRVEDKTLAEIRDLRLKHDGQITEHPIPTLRDALQNVRGRFMVDIDYKSGFEHSAAVLREILRETGFEDSRAPLITLFCRDTADYEALISLNDIYAVRPLYRGKEHVKEMARSNIQVIGLRNYQFTRKRAARIHRLNMNLFVNTMEYSVEGLLRDLMGLSTQKRKPKRDRLLGHYREAMDVGSLFIQTDYLPDLVTFLKEHELYQHEFLDRHFRPIKSDESDGPLIT